MGDILASFEMLLRRVLSEVLASILRAPPPEHVPLGAEAKRRSMSTSAFRDWCLRHGVPIHEDNHRDAWVSPTAVDRAILGMPTATRAPSRAKATRDRDELDDAVSRAITNR